MAQLRAICLNKLPEEPCMTILSKSLFAAPLKALIAGLAFIAFTAHAAPFTQADEKSVRHVIEGQLAALAKDDAVKAFSFAAPNVHQAVGNAAGFLDMVRRGYPVVYRHASVAFLKAEGKDDVVMQRVQMTDTDGMGWLAVYTLERQKGNIWKITGCQVVENKATMA
jgi:hypothetical protein